MKLVLVSTRGVRSLNSTNFPAPWPFVKKGAFGQRKIGPMNYEKFKWPGQNREFPELSPKFQKLNPKELHRYTGVQADGFHDEKTGEFVPVKEMRSELVVPNLDGFKLRPYVSYRTDVQIEKRRVAYEKKVLEKGSERLADLHTVEDERWPPPKMSAETLFELAYGDTVRSAYKEGKYGNK
ncbi:Large ribosomal subunit protein mL41 [Caenorhabditis elegans]|uniref:Large ribosomal subunit protein mL41 n=1 Tax=Caenorhabditis elegans TaxID=6239 RepID=RM41_CAEEL|nr:Large ribosomal subunit protein mL41 [Caenorhabditis elegans]P90993.1 RecName: Full=Large ribosomal subunit protein mL41; AltName: Full=39S ribosomal protein L41, mitochondrial; Short=L41mt; Short=MRP-L41; Flags: Precursor [Caenorhabditis elegans]CCD61937.1 Large ribosomal subunit protein mL41 [Caenorhabditis elegans]|eukprot:NP_493695.1 39S ribosomal protein L41, mitochondrial [Caenorhabditis elegans]